MGGGKKECTVCGAEASFKCDRCRGVRYCSAECHQSDTYLKKVAYHRSTGICGAAVAASASARSEGAADSAGEPSRSVPESPLHVPEPTELDPAPPESREDDARRLEEEMKVACLKEEIAEERRQIAEADRRFEKATARIAAANERTAAAKERTAAANERTAAADERFAAAVKPRATFAADAAYPTERVLGLHDQEAFSRLVVPSAKEQRKLFQRRHVILREVAEDRFRHVRAGAPCVVSKADFAKHFDALTCGLFADWSRDDWANVVVAGGAVLLCALPIPENFPALRSKAGGGVGFDFDFRDEERLFKDEEQVRNDRSGKSLSLDWYIQRERWKAADVDVFFHGIDREDAQAKLVHLLRKLRRAVKMEAGVEHDVVFVKTPNTITVESGSPRRKIQFITRLYSTAAEVLNGFDIDACCLGYDGVDVTITERAVEALRTRINTVNLAIRGECYEMRLLKYAERGFAICAPGLERNDIDRDWFRITVEKCAWGDYETTTTRDFAKWAQAQNMERLLLAEAISRQTGGWIDNSFASRKKKIPGASVPASADMGVSLSTSRLKFTELFRPCRRP